MSSTVGNEGRSRLYLVTDVEELHKWNISHCDAHPLFRRVPDEECITHDPAVQAMLQTTEEGVKVARLGGLKYFAVYERLTDEDMKREGERLCRVMDLWREDHTQDISEENKSISIQSDPTSKRTKISGPFVN